MATQSYARHVRWVIFSAAMAASSAGCGPRPQSNDLGGVRASDVITIDEILTTKTQNAYDAVRRLRPSFLQTRGPTTLLARDATPTAPLVYLDNRRYGDIESLRTITVEGVFEIRYLSPNQAQLKWGMNHASGVIHVLSMSGRSAAKP